MLSGWSIIIRGLSGWGKQAVGVVGVTSGCGCCVKWVGNGFLMGLLGTKPARADVLRGIWGQSPESSTFHVVVEPRDCKSRCLATNVGQTWQD